MKPSKWIFAALAVVLGMIFSLTSYLAHAERVTLEHQTKEFQCAYKAKISANLVDVYMDADAGGYPKPDVQVLFDTDSTPAEQAIVAEFMQYAWKLSRSGISPADAFRETLATCLSAMDVGWDPRKDTSFIKVQENVYTMPELPPLNYADEWCFNMVSDAKLIASALNTNVMPDVIHANIKQVDYFSPQRKRSAHALVVDAMKTARDGLMGPEQWVQSIIDACTE